MVFLSCLQPFTRWIPLTLKRKSILPRKVFKVLAISWLSLHDSAFPQPHIPPLLLTFWFPCSFLNWPYSPSWMPRKTFPCIAIFPLHPAPFNLLLTSTHLAGSHWSFKVPVMHHFLLEACQDPPTRQSFLLSLSARLHHCTSPLCCDRGFLACLLQRQVAPWK